MKKIDAFLFFNELDLLEIRLNLLYDYFDKFVISESTVTFTGKQKELFFNKNKGRFSKFKDKIVHQVIDDTPSDFFELPFVSQPTTKDDICTNMILSFIEKDENLPREQLQWGREFFQRESLHRALLNCSEDDVVMFSDVDEIPNPAILRDVFAGCSNSKFFTLLQKNFCYYLNFYQKEGWFGPRVANYGILKDMSLNYLRAGGKTTFDGVEIDNGGWHFTSLGGTEKILEKISSWGHQEFNNEKVRKNVEKRVARGQDIFFRRGEERMQRIEISNDVFPEWLVENKEKYAHLIHCNELEGTFFEKISGWFKKVLNR